MLEKRAGMKEVEKPGIYILRYNQKMQCRRGEVLETMLCWGRIK